MPEEEVKSDDEFVPVSIYIIVSSIFLLNIGQFLRNTALRYFSYKRIETYLKALTRFDWTGLKLTKTISDIHLNSKV